MEHWQLQIAEKSLKKQEKIQAIHQFIEPLAGKTCLEVGCDKGVLSYHLRQWGGDWISVDADEENLRITMELVKEGSNTLTASPCIFKTSSLIALLRLIFWSIFIQIKNLFTKCSEP